jgi:hypothetical protein
MNWLEAADIVEDFYGDSHMGFDDPCPETYTDFKHEEDTFEDFGSEKSTNIYSSIKSSPAEPPSASPPPTLIKLPHFCIPQDQRRSRNNWTFDDDALLSKLAHKYKYNWKKVAKHMPYKSITSIQKRWTNRHDPNIKKARWTEEEDSLLLSLFEQLGGNWRKIAKRLTGRPPDAIKNRFYGSIKKKLPPEDKLKYSKKSNKIQISHSSLGLEVLHKIEPESASDDAIVTSFLANADSQASDEALELPRKVMDISLNISKPPTIRKIQTGFNPEQRKEKIKELYTKMQALEQFLAHTKCEMKRLEQEIIIQGSRVQ